MESPSRKAGKGRQSDRIAQTSTGANPTARRRNVSARHECLAARFIIRLP